MHVKLLIYDNLQRGLSLKRVHELMHNYPETTVKVSKTFMVMMIIIIVINALFKLEKSFSIKNTPVLTRV